MKARNLTLMALAFGFCCFLHQYANAQTQLWAKKLTPMVFYYQTGYSIKREASGNIYYAYTSVHATTYDLDFEIAKFSPSGTQLWRKIYNGGKEDILSSMNIDGAGNIYLGGSSNSATGTDFLLVKYDSSGARLWAKRYNGAANKDDFLSSIAFDSANNIYVTGSETISATASYCVTAKYNTAGTRLWIKKVHLSTGNDMGLSIQVAADNSVYVAGDTSSAANGMNGLLIKYNSDGMQQWQKTWDGAAHLDDGFGGIKLDASGNVYVGGVTWASTLNPNTLLVKYSPAGTLLWQKTYDGASHGRDYIYDGVIDSAGNVYVVGESKGTTYTDALLLKYSPTGTLLYTKRINIASPATGNASFRAISLDNAGNLYMAGFAPGGNTPDLFVAKYTAAGARIWTKRYDDSVLHSEDWGVGIAVDPLIGEAYVAGASFYDPASNFPGAVLLKYK